MTFRLSFDKETEELAKKEIARLESERKSLRETVITRSQFPNIKFKFDPRFTMIDGKTKNITGNG